MKTMLSTVSSVDLLLFGMGVLLAVGIVCVNGMPAPERNAAAMGGYMEKILTRMDAVGSQLARWERLDVNQYRR